MTHTHAELVDLSGSIARNIGLWKHWADLFGKWGRGERPDRFGMFDRMHPELWRDESGESIKCFPGDTFVFECKAFASDAQRDRLKKWRQNIAEGVGNFRAFVAPIGVIDPSDLVGSPWGLWEVDDAGSFVMTRAPMRINQVNRGHENILLGKLVGDTSEPDQVKRNGATKSSGLKPYHHEILDRHLGDSASFKEIASTLLVHDDRLTAKKARELAHEAMQQGVPGFEPVQSGLDWFLERETQTQGA